MNTQTRPIKQDELKLYYAPYVSSEIDKKKRLLPRQSLGRSVAVGRTQNLLSRLLGVVSGHKPRSRRKWKKFWVLTREGATNEPTPLQYDVAQASGKIWVTTHRKVSVGKGDSDSELNKSKDFKSESDVHVWDDNLPSQYIRPKLPENRMTRDIRKTIQSF